MIKVENLSKIFKSSKKFPGFLGSIKGLFTREYIEKVAVNDISFEIASGDIVGYIGSNGAGKSTTIKIMTGILTPTSGTVLVDGVEPYKNRQLNAKKNRSCFWSKNTTLVGFAFERIFFTFERYL